MTTKPFHIEYSRDDITLNGGSLDGTEMEEVVLRDGTEAYMFAIPRVLVSTKWSLRTARTPLGIPAPAKEIGPSAEDITPTIAPEAEPEAKEDKPEAKSKDKSKDKEKTKPGPKPDYYQPREPVAPTTGIETLKLTGPTTQRLTDNSVTTVGQLSKMTENDLLDMGLSHSTAALIRSALYKAGHSLTVTEPKLSDICLVPVTRRRLNEQGIITVDDLTKWTAEELRLIRGCNGSQIDKFQERLARFGKTLKTA